MKALAKNLFILGCISILACVGCIGPQYSKHDLIVSGKPAPHIHGPHDPAIAANLTTNFWPSQPFLGGAAEVGTTLFKSAGIQGWKDYHMNARATGVALRHEFSSGPYLTLDMSLQSLVVKHVPVPVHGIKYMRVVVFLADASVAAAVYERTNPVIVAQGKLVWNFDGWFEIQPEKTGDVQLAPIVPTSTADQILSR